MKLTVQILPTVPNVNRTLTVEVERDSVKALVDELKQDGGIWMNNEKSDWMPYTRIYRVWTK